MAHQEKFDRQGPEERPLPDRRAESDFDRLTIMRLVGTDSGARVPRDKLIDLACRLYESRRKRARYFHNSLLGEPVWDMLLALFCLPTAQWRRLTVSRLSEAAGVPLTTSLRWSKVMEQKGLIERSPDPLDARRIFVALSEKGERLMCEYLSSVYDRMVDSGGRTRT